MAKRNWTFTKSSLRRAPAMPKTLKACIELAGALDEHATMISNESSRIATMHGEVMEHIINNFKKDELRRVDIAGWECKLRPSSYFSIEDSKKFYAYVNKHKANDLLQRRVHNGAVQARLDAGQKIPGIKVFNKLNLSIKRSKA